MKLFIRAHDLGVKGEENIVKRLDELGLSGVQLVAYKCLDDVAYAPGAITTERAEAFSAAFGSAGKTVPLIGAYFNPVHPNEEKIRLGKAVFKDYLAHCHELSCDVVGSETGSYNGDKWTYHPQNRTEEALSRVIDTHMSVYENLAFGLTLQGVDDDVIEQKVLSTAKILGLSDYLDRKPRELSGGQRQRVAVGRAIIRKVDIFLMDEPLSNLDAKQRVTMRSEITQIHRETGATTIYVTHDQTEAMTMADRIVVMKDGYIQQVGTPYDLYFNPANMFVAGFIGEPPMNFISATVKDGKIEIADTSLDLSKIADKSILDSYEGKEISLGFRPEAVKLGSRESYAKSFKIPCYVELSLFVVFSAVRNSGCYGNIETPIDFDNLCSVTA